MIFKMYGKYKYNLDKDLYEDSDGNTIIVSGKGKHWFAKFVDNEGEENEELNADCFENLDVMIENYIYSLKTPKEIMETFPKPPGIDEETKILTIMLN